MVAELLAEAVMAISVRARFEVFKRDEFTCQYCGKKSPEVVLEPDHIVPLCEGGSDDPINLRTACYECNRGKGGVPLATIITGEDPHDRAIFLLERERQLREYNEVLRLVQERVDAEFKSLCTYWCREVKANTRYRGDLSGRESVWLRGALEKFPAAMIRRAMTFAVARKAVTDFRYVNACLRNWNRLTQSTDRVKV
jgi:hypothetical protein